MNAELARMPSQYEVDSEALNAIYEGAYTKLAQHRRMDDECRSKLVTIVLKTYFFERAERDPVGIEPLVEVATAAFESLISLEC